MTQPPYPSIAPAPTPAPDITYTPQAFQRGGPDLYGLTSPSATVSPISEAPGPAKFSVLSSRRIKGKGTVYYWKYTKYTSGLGLNKTRGFLDRDHAKLKSSSLWSMDEERLTLPPISTKQGIGPTDITMSSWTMAFGRFIMAFGGNSAGTGEIWRETSGTSPIMASWLTGFTGAAVHMAPMSINSLGPRLVVCRTGNSPIMYSDLVPTTTTLMNADLLNCTGFIQTSIQQTPGASVILFACPGLIRSKLSTDTEISASTLALSGLPYLSYPIGLLQWSGKIRAFWGSPPPGGTHSPLDLNATVDERWVTITHTNQQGQDPDEARLPTMDKPIQVIIYRDGLCGHDGTRIVWKTTYPRGSWRDFRIQRDLDPHSDRQRIVVDIGVVNGVFVASIDEVVLAGAGVSSSYFMAYDFDLDVWHQISMPVALGSGARTVASVPGIPWSVNTLNIHGLANDSNMRYQFSPPWGMDWYTFRQIEADHVGQAVAPTGTAAWPEYILPEPMEYSLSVTDAIWFGGEIGPDGSQVQITAGGVTATFKGPLSAASRYVPFPDNHGVWGPTLSDLAGTMTIDGNGANITKNMQMFPFTVYAHSFVPDRPQDQSGWWPDALSVAP